MDKKEILEIESKRKGDEYLKDVRIKGARIGSIVLLIGMFLFFVIDFIKGEPLDYRFFVLVFGINVVTDIYIYIKSKEKQYLITIILWSILTIAHLIKYIQGLI